MNGVPQTVYGIAAVLGGKQVGRDTVLCPGPGHSPKDRSLAVRIDPAAPDGFLIYSHAGDDWRACRDYVRHKLGLPTWEPGDERQRAIPQQHVLKWDLAANEADAAEIPRLLSEDELERIAFPCRIWNEGRDPRGTPAETYIREARKLDLPDNLAETVLRFHADCPWRDENSGKTNYIPALIAAFRSIDDDSVTAVHRIRLDRPERWPKAERRMLGIVHRSAIKLDPLAERLAIGEGLETCMAARQLGHAPNCWALGSVGAISFFPLLDDVKQLVILGEQGPASARAVKIAGTRWRKTGRRVRVIIPDTPFSDLNDVLIAEKAS
jgi:putative DNA primase/helicase